MDDELGLFSRFLDGEGDIEAFLEKHPSLREEWARWQAMDDTLRSVPAESPSPGFVESVMSRLEPASAGEALWQWGMAWIGGVLLSGMLLAGVIFWYLIRNPTWITSAMTFAVSGGWIVQTALRAWHVWAGAMATVIRGLIVPVAAGVAMYVALTIAVAGALLGRKHHHAIKIL